MIHEILKPKSQEDIDRAVAHLPPAKKFSTFLRSEVEFYYQRTDLCEQKPLSQVVQETVNKLDAYGLKIKIDLTQYDPYTFATEVNIWISEEHGGMLRGFIDNGATGIRVHIQKYNHE